MPPEWYQRGRPPQFSRQRETQAARIMSLRYSGVLFFMERRISMKCLAAALQVSALYMPRCGMLIYPNVEPEFSLGFNRKSIAARYIEDSIETHREASARDKRKRNIVRELVLRSSPIGVYQAYARVDARIWIWVIKNKLSLNLIFTPCTMPRTSVTGYQTAVVEIRV